MCINLSCIYCTNLALRCIMQEPTMTMNTKAAMLDVMDMFDGTISLDVAMENATETLPVKGVMFVSAAVYMCTHTLALHTIAQSNYLFIS